MIESSRRHGHFDARWHTKGVNPPRALASPAHDCDPIQSWENEGGRFSMSNENDTSAGLEWDAFSTRYFLGERRHNLEALKAYEAYRSAPSRRALVRDERRTQLISFGVAPLALLDPP
jgi:hypothetical protein